MFETVIIPSGMHVGFTDAPISYGLSPIPYVDPESPFSGRKLEICNPMAATTTKQIQFTPVEKAANCNDYFLGELQASYKNARTVSRGELDSFGSCLLDMRKTLSGREYDGIIVPLRGGLKPWTQLHVLGEKSEKPIWLPYTGGSTGKFDEQIRFHLTEELKPLSDSGRLKLAVIDTAMGGNGSEHLAQLITGLHAQDPARKWDVDFHLMCSNEFPKLSWEIPKYSTDSIHFNPYDWRVDSLLVEDWNEAIGLQGVGFDGNQITIKPASTDGHLILKENDGTVRVLKSNELHHAVDVLIAESVSDAVRSDPLLEYERDVWQRYQVH